MIRNYMATQAFFSSLATHHGKSKNLSFHGN
uniref:Uncharacterized protein n=1 Tax=Triticum urartu TaxID=4572 RepID=A0A8R7P025_TRIUA